MLLLAFLTCLCIFEHTPTTSTSELLLLLWNWLPSFVSRLTRTLAFVFAKFNLHTDFRLFPMSMLLIHNFIHAPRLSQNTDERHEIVLTRGRASGYCSSKSTKVFLPVVESNFKSDLKSFWMTIFTACLLLGTLLSMMNIGLKCSSGQL